MQTRRKVIGLVLAGAAVLAGCASPTVTAPRVERFGALQPLRVIVFTHDTPRDQLLEGIPGAQMAIRHHLYTALKERGVTVAYHSTTISNKDKPYPPLPQYLADVGASHWLEVRIPLAKVLVGTNTTTGQQVFAVAKSFPLIVTVHSAASGDAVWRFSAQVDAGSFQHASKVWKDVLLALEADGLAPGPR